MPGSIAGTSCSSRSCSPSSKTAVCYMLDSADDILPAALHYLGLDPNSTKRQDLDEPPRCCRRSGPRSANSIRPNISTRWRAAKFAWLSAGLATSSRRRSAPRRRRTASRSAMRFRKKARRCGSTISRSRRTRRIRPRRYAFIDYLLRAGSRGEEQQFRRLCQRQSGKPEIHRQVRARRPRRLSGRGDHGEALHRPRARPARRSG